MCLRKMIDKMCESFVCFLSVCQESFSRPIYVCERHGQVANEVLLLLIILYILGTYARLQRLHIAVQFVHNLTFLSVDAKIPPFSMTC